LDAGNDETLLALRRPASKKRQGTKSREVGHRLSSERYGDLILTPAVMVGAMLVQGDLDGCVRKGARKSAMGISVVAWTLSTGDRLVDQRDCAEQDRRQRGASASERES